MEIYFTGDTADTQEGQKNEKIPTREEIPKEHTWDLSKLFPDPETWEEGLGEFEHRIPRFKEFSGTLGTSASSLKKCLDYLMETERLDERLGYYAHLRTTENIADDAHQERFSRYMRITTKFSAETSFIIPEIQAIPKEKLDSFLNTPELQDYKVVLRKILRYKPYVLSPAEEKLLAKQAEAKQTPEKAFSSLTNVDMDFGSVTTPEGEKPLSQSTYGSLMIHPDRSVREKTYRKFYRVFEGHKQTLASLYEGSVQQDIYEADVRGYPSTRAMGLFPDKVPEEVYDNLIRTVHQHLPSLHRYYELRRKALGLDTLAHWDVYVPIVKDIKTNYSYEEAVETVYEALAPLGEEYRNTLKEGLTGGWVDRYENKGKRSGAFSAGSYDGDPYILMNYKSDVLRDLFTLAHEGGHSMHSWYSARNNPFQHYNYTIFEAEVASTFNEQLTARYLLDHAEDEKMKAYVVNKQVDDFAATVFRQTMFAEFEHLAHKMAEEGTPLTLDTLRKTYRSLLETYFGRHVHLPEAGDLEGLRIPHFYRAFYVYKYATGLSASVSLAGRVMNGGETERQQYLSFLKSGGSRFPLESLQVAGVDMSSPEPIQRALETFAQNVENLGNFLRV
ncbi:MAG: oligoendopeptidase F [Spirochaetia bacterium]